MVWLQKNPGYRDLVLRHVATQSEEKKTQNRCRHEGHEGKLSISLNFQAGSSPAQLDTYTSQQARRKKTATATARSDPGQCAAAAGSPNLWNRGQRRVVNPCRFGKCGSRSGTAQGQTPFLSSPARRRRRRVTSSGRSGRGGHVAYRGEVCHGRQATVYGWGCVREVNFYFAVMLHSHSHSARGSWPSLAPVGKGRYAGTRTGCRTKAKAHMQLFLKL